eukprot:18519_1
MAYVHFNHNSTHYDYYHASSSTRVITAHMHRITTEYKSFNSIITRRNINHGQTASDDYRCRYQSPSPQIKSTNTSSNHLNKHKDYGSKRQQEKKIPHIKH